MRAIDLDHNATTPLLPEAWEAMRAAPAGNPSSAHSAGRRARQALEDARERIAALVGAFPDEVTFTSGATEANNLAVLGLAACRVAVSHLEHPCVIEPLRHLEAPLRNARNGTSPLSATRTRRRATRATPASARTCRRPSA